MLSFLNSFVEYSLTERYIKGKDYIILCLTKHTINKMTNKIKELLAILTKKKAYLNLDKVKQLNDKGIKVYF